MSIENEDDLIGLRRVGRVVADTIQLMLANALPGMRTRELDDLARDYFEAHGARSAPQLTYDFPGATCISLNHEVAHGIPGNTIIRPGDLLNVDVSLELDGYFADSGATKIIEPRRPELERLVTASEEILGEALDAIRAGNRLNRIGSVIEAGAKKRGYKVIRNLAGHGVGRALHEQPHDIVNYKNPADRRLATEGLVLAVETFISTGAEYAVEADDGWTLRTPDRSFTAQFEHTVVITHGAPLIMTAR